MALITCPECNREVSDQAVACPKCGYPVAATIAAIPEHQGGGHLAAEESTDLTEVGSLDGEQGSQKPAVIPLLAGGVLVVFLISLATDFSGIKTSLLKLTGNAPPIMRSEEMVRELFVKESELIDPHSAKFRNLMYTDSDILRDTVWCGEVNAKNRMGAYVGWNKFSLTKSKEGQIEIAIYADVSEEVGNLLYDLACKATYPAPAEIALEPR